MKIQLVLGSTAFSPFQRGDRSVAHRALADGLARRGHEVQVLLLAAPLGSKLPTPFEEDEDSVARVSLPGLEVVGITDFHAFLARLRRELEHFGADIVLLATAQSQSLLRTTIETTRAPVCYLAHDVQTLPFGPLGVFPLAPERLALWQRLAGVVAVSDQVHAYLARWSPPIPMRRCHLPWPWIDDPYTPKGDLVCLLGPYAARGVRVLLELARAHPTIRFATAHHRDVAVLESTTAEDVGALASMSNIQRLDDDLEGMALWSSVRLLLAPTMTPAGFSPRLLEGMGLGIPAFVSAEAGVGEAITPWDFVLPIKNVETWSQTERAVPLPVIPPQDITPWSAALLQLTNDETAWQTASRIARDRIATFRGNAEIGRLEEFLGELRQHRDHAAPRNA